MDLPSAKVVMTASPYEGELFKVWAAEQVNLGAKFVVSAHGGAIISRFATYNHEEDIADLKVVWHKPYLSKHIRMAPNKLQKNIKSSRKKITLIGLENPMYPYRAHSGPSGPLMIREIEQKTEFIDCLNNTVRKDFLIRPAPNAGWNTRQRFQDLYGKEILSNCPNLKADYKQSKLIICSYPQTTFSEAMFSGIPTVMLYLENYWEFVPIFDELIDILKSAKIIFSDPQLAAEHINSVCDEPEIWWSSKNVFEARELFFELCAKSSKNPSKEWSKFLNNIARTNNSYQEI